LPRPTEEIIHEPNEHRHFQDAVLRLIDSLLSNQGLMTPLILCLSCIIRLQPIFVASSRAMDYMFHFFESHPENPYVQIVLCETLEQFVLPALQLAEKDEHYFVELRTEYLSQSIARFELASQRAKGDPMILVFLFARRLIRLGSMW
jgi:hypothetical protein